MSSPILRLAVETLCEIFNLAIEEQPSLIASVIVRRRLNAVCWKFTSILCGYAAPWRTLVVGLFTRPEFLQDCIHKTGTSELNVFLDTGLYSALAFSQTGVRRVGSLSFAVFVNKTLPILAGVLGRVGCMCIHTTSAEEMNVVATVLSQIHSPAMRRARFLIRDQTAPPVQPDFIAFTAWPMLQHVVMVSVNPTFGAAGLLQNVTHLRIEGVDEPLDLDWTQLRLSLTSVTALRSLHIGAVICREVNPDSVIEMQQLLHLHLTYDFDDEIEFMTYLVAPNIDTLRVDAGEYGSITALWSCANKLFLAASRIDIQGNCRGVSGIRQILPNLRRLQALCFSRCDIDAGEVVATILLEDVLRSPALRSISLPGRVEEDTARAILLKSLTGDVGGDCHLTTPDMDSDGAGTCNLIKMSLKGADGELDIVVLGHRDELTVQDWDTGFKLTVDT